MSEEIGRLSGSKNIRDTLMVSGETADRNKHEIYEFGPFRLEPAERNLSRDGEVVSLTPKVFDMLVMLVRNNGHLLEKDELIRSLWPDSFVEEGNLSNNIFVLRKALGTDHEYIETVPRRGYRFVGAVRQMPQPAPAQLQEAPPGRPELAMEGGKRGNFRSRKLLFAGIAAALFLLIVAGFILRRFTRAGPAPRLQHLAMEQRLTANPPDVPVNNAVVSPDGRYLAYADPTGLYLRQISSGETRPWSLPKGFVAWPYSWFPDGTHLLVRRIATQPQDLSLSLWNTSLYELSILGGEPQQMANNAASGYVSPDGSRIAYLPMPNVNEVWTPNANEMWMMDSDGSNPRRVASAGGTKRSGIYPNWIYTAAWSPTGQHLAYIENHIAAGLVPVQQTHSLRIIGPNGEGATVVFDDPRIGEALWWAPDGRILFSYREGLASGQHNYGVYSIHVDERTGKATGPPQPITHAEGSIRGMSGTADGKRLVLWRSNSAWQVFIASFDGASHQWKEPRRLTLDTNVNIATAWTADSKAVLFFSNRNGTWKLFKQAIDETTPQVLAEGPSIRLPRLSADGLHVLYVSSSHPEDVSSPVSLMSKPLAGGAPRVVIQGKGIGIHQCAMAPSTMCIFSQSDGPDLVFRSFDLEHGAGRELLRIPNDGPNWSLSSDGSKLAIILDRHRIRFVSLGTGATHEVTVKDWPLDGGDWAANSQTVLMYSRAPSGLPVILEVDQAGKAQVVLRGSANIRFGPMIRSPDGRYGLVMEYIPSDSNAWIVNDF